MTGEERMGLLPGGLEGLDRSRGGEDPPEAEEGSLGSILAHSTAPVWDKALLTVCSGVSGCGV
jgi:hypothetical protein